MTKHYEATLVRGETYSIREYTFEKGKPQIIPASLKAKLEKNAIERVTIKVSEYEKEGLVRPKFKFKEAEASAVTKAERFADLASVADDTGDVDFDEEEQDEGHSDTADSEVDDAEEAETTDEEEDAPKPTKPSKRSGRNK